VTSYIDLGDGNIQMPFGILGGVSSMDRSPNGSLKSVNLTEKNVIVTHAGELYAAYTQTARRKHKPSVEFYENGLVKAVALEEQQEVLTPIGELPAELVTFYESGELHRVFPVDGQISGFWSEEEERAMNIPLSFDFGFTTFTALLSCLCFYKSGAIKSVTLFPDEIITVDTPLGTFTVRHGFSLYETGELKSFEPSVPVHIQTPVGLLTAFDTMSVGVSADENSVTLSEGGQVIGVKTNANRIMAQVDGGPVRWHSPVQKPHPCSDELPYYQPLELTFDDESITITDDKAHTYPLSISHFSVSTFADGSMGCSPADCASCTLCGH